MKTYKTTFYELWQEIIKTQSESLDDEVCKVLNELNEKAKELDVQVSDE